jgi:DNA adenine methylase
VKPIYSDGCKSTNYQPKVWRNAIEGLNLVAERLLMVQFENRPALRIIEHSDTKDTLFYVDPPYIVDSTSSLRAYKCGMSLDDHEALAAALNNCQGKVAYSAYENPIVDELYPSSKWRKYKSAPRRSWSGDRKTEVLYTNYEAIEPKSLIEPRLF